MPEIPRRPLDAAMREQLDRSLQEYEAARRGEGALGALQKEYETKFLKLLEEVKGHVNEFLRDKLDPQRRMLFAYAAEEQLKEFIEKYTAAIEATVQKKMRNSPVYVEAVESFKEAFYDTIWPALPPSMALRKAAGWAGRTTDYELAGYDEAIADAKAGVHIPGETLIIDKKTGLIIGKEPKRSGICFEALWPLERYVFPHDPKIFRRIEEVLNRLYKKKSVRKYEWEHGPKHLLHTDKYAHRIIEIERKRLGDRKPINEHKVLTMAGFHDFWRASDIDVSLYNLAMNEVPDVAIVKRSLYKRKKGIALEALVAGARTPMHASVYFESVREELTTDLQAIRKNLGLVFFEDKAKSTISALNNVLAIMKQTLERQEIILPLPEGQRKKVLTEIVQIAGSLKTITPPDIDRKKWIELIDAFIAELPRHEKLGEIKNAIESLQGQATLDIGASTLRHVKKLEDLIQDLEKSPVIQRDKIHPELEKIENDAIKQVEVVEKALSDLNREKYEEHWKQKFEIIKGNILIRRKRRIASLQHHMLGGDEQAWITVAVFLDMLGYPFYYPDVMNYIKIHDYKFFKPESFEAQIAKDADMLDGIGPDAVERTYHVGKGFGNRYFNPDLTLDERFEYLRTGTKSPDTVSVILSLCFDWPQALNTQAAREIVKREKRVEKMVEELIRFSRQEEKLTIDEMKLLKEIIKKYRKESLSMVEQERKRTAQMRADEYMHDIYYE